MHQLPKKKIIKLYFFLHIKSKQEQWQWQVTSRFQTKDQLFPYKEFLTDFVVFALFCFLNSFENIYTWCFVILSTTGYLAVAFRNKFCTSPSVFIYLFFSLHFSLLSILFKDIEDKSEDKVKKN